MFDLARIEASGLVAQIDYHESIGSTSDRALELGAHGEAALPLLVLAERQSAGRGRGTNRWWSSGGALTFSLVLESAPAQLPQEHWPKVAVSAGVAVGDALQALVPLASVQLKWPNDVYLNGRKLCGILSESIPGCRDRLVIGIGINVNNAIGGWGLGTGVSERNPPDDSPLTTHHSPPSPSMATSLLDFDGLPRDLTDVLLSVLDQFDRRWHELLEGRFDLAAAAYRQRCFLSGKTVSLVQPGGTTIVGVCLGIDEFGGLRLQTEAGPQTIVSGTVLTWDG